MLDHYKVQFEVGIPLDLVKDIRLRTDYLGLLILSRKLVIDGSVVSVG